MKRFLLLFVVLALIAPACGGGDSDDSDPAAQEEPSPEETTPPFGTPEDSQASACDKGPKAKTEIQIKQVDINFKPPELEATAGEMVTVLVSNEGQLEHTFTAPSVDCDTGFIAPGTKATVTFEMPDKAVEFYCVPHKLRMTGEIVPT